MQEEAGFLLQEEKGNWYGTRPANLFDGITCPEGYFKRDEREFNKGCSEAGLSCKDNYGCFCKPCVKAFEVDVYELAPGQADPHLVDYFGASLPGCEKISVCGTIQQRETITLRVYDNMGRNDAAVEVVTHAADKNNSLPVKNIPGTFAYEFSLTGDRTQVHVVDILVNGKSISQSPIQVNFIPRNCEAIAGIGSHRVPDSLGNCVW